MGQRKRETRNRQEFIQAFQNSRESKLSEKELTTIYQRSVPIKIRNNALQNAKNIDNLTNDSTALNQQTKYATKENLH